MYFDNGHIIIYESGYIRISQRKTNHSKMKRKNEITILNMIEANIDNRAITKSPV